MTRIQVAVVDVYPVHLGESGWEVLICERAIGARSPGAWEVVHGRIEPDEKPAEAALRELREETGMLPEAL